MDNPQIPTDGKPDATPQTADAAAKGADTKAAPDAASLLASAAAEQPAGQDAKPPEAAKPEGAKPEGEPAKVPEKYEFKLPEGVEPDAVLVDAFTPVLRDLGMPQDKAQKLADAYLAHQQQEARAAAEQQAQQMAAWHQEFKAGPAWRENLGMAVRAVNEFADDQTKALFNTTWLGSHPGILRMLAKAGKLLAEDRGAADGKGHGETRTTAQQFYAQSNMNP